MATMRSTSVVLSSGEKKEKREWKTKANKIKSKRSLTGAGIYKTKYCSSWESDCPVKDVKGYIYKYLCRRTLSCEHQGLAGIKLHCSRDSHKSYLKSWKKQSILSFQSSSSMNTHDKNVAKAEAKVVNFPVQYNLPLAAADNLGPLFKDIFSDIVRSSYACERT